MLCILIKSYWVLNKQNLNINHSHRQTFRCKLHFATRWINAETGHVENPREVMRSPSSAGKEILHQKWHFFLLPSSFFIYRKTLLPWDLLCYLMVLLLQNTSINSPHPFFFKFEDEKVVYPEKEAQIHHCPIYQW